MPPRKYSPKPYGRAEAVAQLTERRLVVDDVLGLHRLEQVPHLAHPLGGVLDVGLGVVDVGLEGLAQVLEHLLALLVGELGDVDVERLGPQVIVVGEVAVGLGAVQELLAARERLLELEDALLLLGRVGVEDLVDLALSLSRSRSRASSSTHVTIEAAKYRTFSSSLGAMSSR